jgi:HEAT repeat protein
MTQAHAPRPTQDDGPRLRVRAALALYDGTDEQAVSVAIDALTTVLAECLSLRGARDLEVTLAAITRQRNAAVRRRADAAPQNHVAGHA